MDNSSLRASHYCGYLHTAHTHSPNDDIHIAAFRTYTDAGHCMFRNTRHQSFFLRPYQAISVQGAETHPPVRIGHIAQQNQHNDQHHHGPAVNLHTPFQAFTSPRRHTTHQQPCEYSTHYKAARHPTNPPTCACHATPPTTNGKAKFTAIQINMERISAPIRRYTTSNDANRPNKAPEAP